MNTYYLVKAKVTHTEYIAVKASDEDAAEYIAAGVINGIIDPEDSQNEDFVAALDCVGVEIEDTETVDITEAQDIATVSADGVVTAKSAGATVITAETDDGGYKDFCLIRVAGLIPIMNTTAALDYDNGIISGIAPMLVSLDSFVETSEDSLTLAYSTETIGTGTIVNVVRNGEVIDAYTAVLFGDVNNDGIYDGTDAIIVNCLANGLLSREQVGEAVYMAADCNHDAVIDSLDIELLQQAGVFLASVDQSKSEAELMTSSAYVEYLNLIDQNVEAETTEAVEDEPTVPEIEPARPESLIFRIVNAIALVFCSVVNFFTNLFD